MSLVVIAGDTSKAPYVGLAERTLYRIQDELRGNDLAASYIQLMRIDRDFHDSGLESYVRGLEEGSQKIPDAVIWAPHLFDRYNLFLGLDSIDFQGKKLLVYLSHTSYENFSSFADESFSLAEGRQIIPHFLKDIRN